MTSCSVSKERTNSPEEQLRRLAQVYALILSWSKIETETADGDEFGDQTQSAEETPAEIHEFTPDRLSDLG